MKIFKEVINDSTFTKLEKVILIVYLVITIPIIFIQVCYTLFKEGLANTIEFYKENYKNR